MEIAAPNTLTDQQIGEARRARNADCDQEGMVSAGIEKMGRALRDTLISTGSVLLLLLVLVSIDARVREQTTRLVDQGPSSLASSVAWRVTDAASDLKASVLDQSISYAPLMVFAVVAGGLFVLMLRT